jgi:hypothetical protein
VATGSGGVGGATGVGGVTGGGMAAGGGMVMGAGGTGGCPASDEDIVVAEGLPFLTEVASLVFDGALVLLVNPGNGSDGQLYRYSDTGKLLTSATLAIRKGSRLVAAAPDPLLLVDFGDGALQMRWLDNLGNELSATRTDVPLASTSDAAMATSEDLLAVLYQAPSGARIDGHGTMHLATFSLQGRPMGDIAVMAGEYIAKPRAIVATQDGWAATWVIIDESGPRTVYLTEVGRGSPATVATQVLGSFLQGLQGGFPSVPMVVGYGGDLVVAWLDTRDTFDTSDELVLWQRRGGGETTTSRYPVVSRSFHALALAGDFFHSDVLLSTTDPVDSDDAAEVREFHGEIAGKIDTYARPGVRDRYRHLVRLSAGGYALAGEEAKIGGSATIKLVLRQCRD